LVAGEGPTGLSLARSGSVATLTIERERAGNSIDRATASELELVVADLSDDPDLVMVVVTGAGERFFCTGGDVKDYRALRTEQSVRDLSLLMQRTLDALERLPALAVAAINGTALGGGVELALACDVRIADEECELSLPQARLGVIPGWGGTHRLAQAIGRSRALELMGTGRAVPAREALGIGLVDAIAPAGEVMSRVTSLAQHVSEAAPRAARSIKPAVAAGADAEAVADLFAELWLSDDHLEAERAYSERRPPRFTGR
jgi:enoyl-CoA hydratase/carnithine racemase